MDTILFAFQGNMLIWLWWMDQQVISQTYSEMAILESGRPVQMPLSGIDQSLKSQKSYEFYLETFVSKIDFTIGG